MLDGVGIHRVDVGGLTVDHPTVVFYSKGTGRDDVAGSVRIGSAFVKDFVVTIDDLSHAVRLERPWSENEGEPA